MESSGGDHIHDKSDEGRGQLKELKRILNIMPLQPITGFFKIQFESNIPCLTPSRDESSNHLLDNDNVITRTPTRHKTSLTRVNHLCHIGFKPLDNDTRHQFVKGIAKTNGTKLGD